MATKEPTTGMAHLTVVPENFEPTAEANGESHSDRVPEWGDADGADG